MTNATILDSVRNSARELLDELAGVERQLDPHRADEPYRQVAAALDRCLDKLSGLGLWGLENRLPSSELWSVAGHVLSRGWLQNRARTKPRGYAGDYELLARMYQHHLCEDPLGQLFDRYFQEEAAPRAVRNRMRMMADWIFEAISGHSLAGKATQTSPFHLAIVGSAFGLEIKEAVNRLDTSLRQRLRVTLLDLDPEAIEFARRELGTLLGPDQLTAVSANLFRLAQRPQIAALLDGADLIFCPGIFDYLDDAAAAEMLRVLWERLADGGRVTVFQFAPHNPSRAYMEWIANWYLIYRDERQLRALVQAVGDFESSAQFGAEPLGVDLYVSLRRD
jgi:extracellular factor (EF) 3-hydroxypalmitic acid methyl ester biosynthesis protein